jgi:hypothetical protein
MRRCVCCAVLSNLQADICATEIVDRHEGLVTPPTTLTLFDEIVDLRGHYSNSVEDLQALLRDCQRLDD